MASGITAWGIDIGQCALKALKLRAVEGGQVEAVAFDVIEHSKILSQPDADRDELISSALEKFASRNDWQGDRFVIGVPGQQTFARFCKMPPIDLKKDAKKIHDLVRYEASQQIPFDIDDVVWDYQVFTSESSPDIEVGIFAIRKDLIRKHLSYFANVHIAPAGVQTVPAALYNFCHFDGQIPTDGGATVLVDVGAQNTDLVIAEPNSAWTRNIPLGGNSFTEALVRAFKLSFAKAESLKRSAADSKYARQIFQAMRPVFADLVAEIQRSIGFYSSTHRDMELKRVVALGNAFRLPGLLKYLENNLTISGGVSKLEKFTHVVPSATINAPQFSENLLSFGSAYGLALQGLGLAKIRASLLPTELARIAVWQRKRPYFIATAASLALAAGVPWIANALDKQALGSDSAVQARNDTQRIVGEAKRFAADYKTAKSDTGQRKQDIENLVNLQQYKRIVPELLAVVHQAMPEINPPDLAQVTSGEQLKKLVQSDKQKYSRTERGQLVIESFKEDYVTDVAAAPIEGRGAQRTTPEPTATPTPRGGPPPTARPGGPPKPPGQAGPAKGPTPAMAARKDGFIVHLKGRLLEGRTPADAVKWLTDTYLERLREQGQQPGLGFYIPADDPKSGDEKRSIGFTVTRYYGGGSVETDVNPRRPGGESASGAQFVDPVTGEDASTDWKVEVSFKVQLGEMPPPKTEEPAAPGAPGATPGGKPVPAAPPKK